MDESLDDRLEAEALRRSVSKASLIRDAVAQSFGATDEADPINALIGAFTGPAGPPIDDVVYG